ncbi:MAG: hypothetical protein KDI61_02645 [Alphaproteobacteria bacterium]|nr:hypothetical protein [Alphaproteobacteria bacterium]MCB1839148.1 hypothetical protein [Alphaproteobacteria bacterium]
MRHVLRVFHHGVKSILNAGPFYIIFFLGPLCACATTETSAPLAPYPPEVRYEEPDGRNPSLLAAVFFAEQPQPYDFSADPSFGTGPAVVAAQLQAAPAVSSEALAFDREQASKGCSLRDRFDRGEALAYEWDRNRLGVDLKGVGGSGMDGVKLQYTLRLQHAKSSQQACRYASPWQGIAGSVYNEFFLRQDDTVWDELRIMRKNFLRTH